MSTSRKRTDRLAAEQQMSDGVQKVFAKGATLTIGSQTVTPADIVKIFQDRRNSAQAAVAAEAVRAAAVKTDRDTRKKTGPFIQSLRRVLQGMYSESPDTLAELGLKPLKASKPTVATKASAQAKIKATRTARKTMGSKQKKAVKGTVTLATKDASLVPATPANPTPSPTTSTAPTTATKPV